MRWARHCENLLPDACSNALLQHVTLLIIECFSDNVMYTPNANYHIKCPFQGMSGAL